MHVGGYVCADVPMIITNGCRLAKHSQVGGSPAMHHHHGGSQAARPLETKHRQLEHTGRARRWEGLRDLGGGQGKEQQVRPLRTGLAKQKFLQAKKQADKRYFTAAQNCCARDFVGRHAFLSKLVRDQREGDAG